MDTSAAERPRGTVTFLFTDIEGSTELARQLGSDFGRLRSEHRRVLRAVFGDHGGHEIDTAGDGFFIAFERAGDATAAAVAGQRALLALEREERAPLRVRMGLHSAEPYAHEGSYVGVGVHRAARICAAGHGGQILLSNATAGIVEDLGLDGVQLLELGEFSLKDIERPQRLFQVVVDGLPSTFPPLNTPDAAGSHPAVVTLLQTDLIGFRRVLRTLGDDETFDLVTAYHDTITVVVEENDGRVLEQIGDHVTAVFERPVKALHAAVTLRERLRIEPSLTGEHEAPVKMIVHSGRLADPTGRQLGSLALHCLVLMETAGPWQILVSHATEALLTGERLDLRLRDLGERAVDDGQRTVRVFELEEA
jgi:class 3 adenylate cyclase